LEFRQIRYALSVANGGSAANAARPTTNPQPAASRAPRTA